MGNVLLKAINIARRALPLLKNNLVVPELFHTDYSGDFVKQGDEIQIKKPATFVAKDFVDQVTIQEIKQQNVYVKMDKIADVSVEITSKELSMDPVTFEQDVLEPAMEALAEKVNKEGLQMYKNIHKFIGSAGTTPSTINVFADARKMLNVAKAPLTNRFGVWDPDADSKFSIMDAILNAEKSGSTDALREGAIGKVQGMNNYMAQQVAVHKAGTFTAVASPKVVGATLKDATAITIDGGSAAETLVAGDIFSVAGKQYVVTEDATAVSGTISNVKIYPAVVEDISNDADVVFADKVAGGHVANIAFHKLAFAFVTRALEPAVGNTDSYNVSYKGLNLRVTYGYDMKTKKNMLSIDTIYGFAPLYPSLAVTVLG